MKLLLLLAILLASCTRAPLKDPKDAYRLSEAPASLDDSLSIGSLRDALEKTLVAYGKSTIIPAEFRFGERTISREDYRRALESLRPQLEDFSKLASFVRENFEFYEVYGNEEGYGHVFSTGYYDPVLSGSRQPTAAFSRPLYRAPADLVKVDLIAYAKQFPENAVFQELQKEPKAKQLRGRLDAEFRSVTPYFSREQIEKENKLAGKNLELVYLDPIEAFFLEIQGSGLIELIDGGRVRVGYAAENGHPYFAIGKALYHAIPKEQMSMQRIRQHLLTLSPADRDAVLFQNPSYIFFQELPGFSLTYSGAEVTGGRTIATDQGLFAKGVMGFFQIEQPDFADAVSQEPVGWTSKPRWVFDQDTGGAIRGGGRVDLYFGQGEEAARPAGVMKRSGKLWAIAPRENFLERLRAANLH